MVDQVAGIIISFQLIPVVFPRNGKHEVAYHRKSDHKKHIAQVLQKENGKDPGINEAVLRERWQADTGMGIIRCLDVTDFTTRHPDGSRLSYHGKQDPNRIGQ